MGVDGGVSLRNTLHLLDLPHAAPAAARRLCEWCLVMIIDRCLSTGWSSFPGSLFFLDYLLKFRSLVSLPGRGAELGETGWRCGSSRRLIGMDNG